MPKYLEIEIAIQHIKPKIWRRMLISPTATFMDLHDAIQDAGPWEGYHMWEFCIDRAYGKKLAGPKLDDDPFDDEPAPLASKVKLAEYFERAGKKCVYVYDFGDDWIHDVRLKRTVELAEVFRRRLVAGERAFPPEDCGSGWGYFECLAAVGALPENEMAEFDEDQLAERREWLGDWTPEWDLEAARKKFDC